MIDLVTRLKATLPGRIAAPAPGDGSRPAAVLVPLYEDEAEWRVLFTKRTDKVDQHKGQISFPGGAKDPEDENLRSTALRETAEEIGVDPGDVEVLGALCPLKTISNFLVHPFVGVIPFPYDFKLNSFEVDSLVEVPLAQLIAEAEAQFSAQAPAASLKFNRRGEIIWGATARIIFQFLKTVFLDQKEPTAGGLR